MRIFRLPAAESVLVGMAAAFVNHLMFVLPIARGLYGLDAGPDLGDHSAADRAVGEHHAVAGGEFVDERPYNNAGAWTSDGGHTFTGEWSFGRPLAGRGSFNDIKTGLLLTGKWLDGRLEGAGSAVYPDSSAYEGQFKAGWRDGTGRMSVVAADGSGLRNEYVWFCYSLPFSLLFALHRQHLSPSLDHF